MTRSLREREGGREGGKEREGGRERERGRGEIERGREGGGDRYHIVGNYPRYKFSQNGPNSGFL